MDVRGSADFSLSDKGAFANKKRCPNVYVFPFNQNLHPRRIRLHKHARVSSLPSSQVSLGLNVEWVHLRERVWA